MVLAKKPTSFLKLLIVVWVRLLAFFESINLKEREGGREKLPSPLPAKKMLLDGESS